MSDRLSNPRSRAFSSPLATGRPTPPLPRTPIRFLAVLFFPPAMRPTSLGGWFNFCRIELLHTADNGGDSVAERGLPSGPPSQHDLDQAFHETTWSIALDKLGMNRGLQWILHPLKPEDFIKRCAVSTLAHSLPLAHAIPLLTHARPTLSGPTLAGSTLAHRSGTGPGRRSFCGAGTVAKIGGPQARSACTASKACTVS